MTYIDLQAKVELTYLEGKYHFWSQTKKHCSSSIEKVLAFFLEKTPYDTVILSYEGKKNYVHFNLNEVEVLDSKRALRKRLSQESGGAWIEQRGLEKSYFIDISSWFGFSYQRVSKEQFVQKLKFSSTLLKVLGVGLGILALLPDAFDMSEHLSIGTTNAGLGLLALQKKNPLLVLLGISLIPSSVEAQAMGTEFQVNTYTTGDQSTPKVAVLEDSKFVSVWASNGQDGDGWGIFGQMFHSNGLSLGREFPVNTHTAGDQLYPCITAVDDGGFVVAWQSDEDQDGIDWDICGQRFQNDGSPLGSEFLVGNTSENERTCAASRIDGGYVIIGYREPIGGGFSRLFGQRYRANGVQNGGEFQITTNGYVPSVTAFENEGFVVAWQQGISAEGGIFSQRYAIDASTLGQPFQVNEFDAEYLTSPNSALANSNNDFVIAWLSYQGRSRRWEVYGKIYNKRGDILKSDFQINTYSSNDQIDATTAMLFYDLGFVAAWTSYGQDGSWSGVYGQQFTSNGTQYRGEFQINTRTEGRQARPSVSGFKDGGYVVIWESDNQDGDLSGIFGQLYNSYGDPIGRPPLTATPSSAPLITQNSYSSYNEQTQEYSSISPVLPTGRDSTESTDGQPPLRATPSSTPLITQNSYSSYNEQTQEYSSISPVLPTGRDSIESTDSVSNHSESTLPIVTELTYEELYPIILNSENIGMFRILGGTGKVSIQNNNLLRVFLAVEAMPQFDEPVALFTIPSDERNEWEGMGVELNPYGCEMAYGEIVENSDGLDVYQIVIEEGFMCMTKASQLHKSLLSLQLFG